MASAPPPDQPPTYNEATAVYPAGPSAPAPSGYGQLPGTNYTATNAGYNQPTDAKAYPGYPPYQGGYQQTGGAPGQYPIQSQPTYMTAPGTTITVQPQPQVIVVGGCPACRTGVLEDDFTCLGVCCAIFFFPIGILCCLAMRQRRCPNCGAVFG